MASEPNAERVKPKLLARLREARSALRDWIGDLSEDERAAIGAADSWAPKDTITHLTSWRRIAVARLEALQRGEPPPGEEDVQRHNAETFERERLRSWDDALAESDAAFDALLANVDALTEAQLTDTSYPWLGGWPLWATVTGSFEHPLEHLADYYRQRGDLPRAEQLIDQQASGLLELADSDRMRAYVRYNQGCFSALIGRPDRAIPLLREALTLDPALADESRQNAALDSLRDLPEFQAIYTSLGEQA